MSPFWLVALGAIFTIFYFAFSWLLSLNQRMLAILNESARGLVIFWRMTTNLQRIVHVWRHYATTRTLADDTLELLDEIERVVGEDEVTMREDTISHSTMGRPDERTRQ